MIKIILIFILCLIDTSIILTNEVSQTEIDFYNFSSTTVTVYIYPVGMVFTGNYYANPPIYTYSLLATTPEHYTLTIQGTEYDIQFNYITGMRLQNSNPTFGLEMVPSTNSFYGFNFDASATNTHFSNIGLFGYGVYKVVFSWIPLDEETEYSDTCWYEMDAVQEIDLTFKIIDDEYGDPLITYKFVNNYPPGRTNENDIFAPISSVNRYIKLWKPYSSGYCGNCQWLERPGGKVYGNFNYNVSYYNLFPLDARKNCNLTGIPAQNQIYHIASGDLRLNLAIDKNNITTPVGNDRINFPTYINILKDQANNGATLTINSYKSLTLPYDDMFPYNYNRYTQINNYYKLILNSTNATLNIGKKNRLYLYQGSELKINQGCTVNVACGALLCNYGGIISGNGIVYFDKRCNIYCWGNQDFLIQDSAQIIIDDSTSWELDPNSTIILEGNTTCLRMNPHSQIKFGSNSKLILQNGAHLVADSATFTSLDANSTWDGIYLSNFANDTIKNCVIQNATNGINIQDKNYSVLGTPTVEISNCTFSNTTNTQLTNGIYVNNCSNVLIKGNNFTSSQLAQGFTSGIITEYCLPGSPVIVDNNIDKVLTGIFVVQSSPYIARNTITGIAESGKGIQLDNSNGTIKYNIVSNFVNSYLTGYSSPYLLKNTFTGASEKNIDLYNSSVPVMRPINSGTTLSWLAGNNVISGSPSVAGMSYQEESYPCMDSGFNKMNVGSSYYMSGEIPSSQDGELQAARNYWTDEPGLENFAVTGGVVIYDPTFDGSSLPPTDYYDLNDIGFGLYDTVYIESLGDNPGADNLFMQANQKEREHNYIQAISLYKQVITNYRNSNYAFLSLSRIFNCVEKKISTNNEYQLLQNYMNQIKTGNTYHNELRELAEDFVIKAKVKQGLLQTAISDYEAMYQQNQNNHKGIHALINKECLIAMLNDSGDLPGAQNNFANIANHKLRLLSLITGRDLSHLMVTDNNQLPFEYKLYQNYPNPFNPKTTIKYDLPKEGFVTFKVYDVLGKEIYSVREYKTAGTHQITIDGSNYASGLYFYRIEIGSYVETKKMVLIK